MKNIMKQAHEMTKEIKREYPEVNYKFQLGLCLSFLAKKGDNNMTIEEIIKKINNADFDYKEETNSKLTAKRWIKGNYDRLYVNHIVNGRKSYTYGYYKIENNNIVEFVRETSKLNRYSASMQREIQELCESLVA